MSTKLAKARLVASTARQVAKDAKASTKPLKAENRRLRNALINIAEMFAGEEPGRIAQEALVGIDACAPEPPDCADVLCEPVAQKQIPSR